MRRVSVHHFDIKKRSQGWKRNVGTYFFSSSRMWCSEAVGNIVLILLTVASVSIGVGLENDVSCVCCCSICWWFLIKLPMRGVWGDERDKDDISCVRREEKPLTTSECGCTNKAFDPLSLYNANWMAFEQSREGQDGIEGACGTYHGVTVVACLSRRDWASIWDWIALKRLCWIVLSWIHLNVWFWGSMQRLKYFSSRLFSTI